jgi:Protein of unknown function (DUF2442)
MLRIRSARALNDYRVRLTLTNGDAVKRDLTDIVWGPVFQPLLCDYAPFRQVRVEAGTLTWPGELDFDPDTLIWGGAPSDPSSRPPRFLKLERGSPAVAG